MIFQGMVTRYQKLIYQFSRYAGIGFLNTGVDFTLINLMIAFFGITAGFKLSLINAVSFILAVIHSFYWNKFWAFGGSEEKIWKTAMKAASAGGLGILTIISAVWGAQQKLAYSYFAAVILLLLVAEVIMWFAFRLRFTTVAIDTNTGKQMGLFITVSVIGTVINSSIIGLITGFIPPLFGLHPRTWANLAKIFATAIALLWNFIGYKVLVFKK